MTDEERSRDGEEIEHRLNDAMAQIIHEVTGSYVVKWVAAVEIIPEDGDRGVYSFTSPEATRYDIYGLLKELDNFELAHTVAQIIEDHRRYEDE